MECHNKINKQENSSIVKVTVQISRRIAGATYIRILTNKNGSQNTIAQFTSVYQPPSINEDISFNISDDPDNIEIQAETVSGGSMQQTDVKYVIEFGQWIND